MKNTKRVRGHFMIDLDQHESIHNRKIQDKYKKTTASALVRLAIKKLLES